MIAAVVTPVRERVADDTPPPIGGPPRYFAMSETAHGALLAGTCGRGVTRSVDGGGTWQVIEQPFEGVNVNGFSDGAGATVLAAAGAGGLVTSPDGGATWSPIDGPGDAVYCAVALGDALLAGTSAGVRCRAGTGEWSQEDGPDSDVYRLVPLADGGVAAATEASGVWRRDENGSWTPLGLADLPVYALVALDNGDLLAGTRGAGIHRWPAAGTRWDPVADPPADAVIHTIVPAPGGSLFAGTGQGVVRAGADGDRWSPVGAELAHHRIFSVLASSSGAVFAGSYDGVWVMNADGDEWSPVDTGLDAGAMLSIAVDRDGIAFAGGRRGACRSVDRGSSWTTISADEHGGNVYAFCRAGDDLWVGTDDGVWNAVHGLPGEPWQRAGMEGKRVYTLVEMTPGQLLAGTLGEGLWMRPSREDEWTRCAGGMDHPLVFDLLRSPATRHVFAATGVLVGAGKSGGIYRSTDGVEWEPAELEANTVYDLVEMSTGQILGGAQRCRILRSTDAGRSFATTRPRGRDESKMYCLARDGADRLYLGAGSELLRSDDAGDSWQVVGSGLDGVTVFGLASCDDGTLVAATSSGIYRSTDSAVTWTPSG